MVILRSGLWRLALLGALQSPRPSAAQGVATLLTEGRAITAMRPAEALRRFEQVVALDSLDYDANWLAAEAAASLGQQTPDGVKSPERDSLYARAVRYARRAVRVDSARAEGHFALAMALGRLALTKAKRERARYAAEIRAEALRALARDSTQDGAHHVLGLWNAEIMRLSGFNRFFAKTFLGAAVFGQASWEEATRHLEESVRLDSTRIYHRLNLARVYLDRKRYAEARAQLEAIARLPDRTALDRRYREEARELWEAISRRG